MRKLYKKPSITTKKIKFNLFSRISDRFNLDSEVLLAGICTNGQCMCWNTNLAPMNPPPPGDPAAEVPASPSEPAGGDGEE